MQHLSDTIVAMATAPITSALHIIRVSGNDAYSIISKLAKKRINKANYRMEFTRLYSDDKLIDEVILLKYLAPRSYTGEDMIEISCHGSVYIAQLIIETLIKYGARMAEHGEFTKRAYLNRKLNLLQAEAVNNVINVQSAASLNLAHHGLSKTLTHTIDNLSHQLFMIIGQIEVNIDYSEYDDVPQLTHEQIYEMLKQINLRINNIIHSTINAQPVINGINVAIVGKPNVGKSSLLNALLNQNKAIVSNVPGTTRDVLQYSSRIGDLLFNFIDTAGIHQPKNHIEKLSINLAKKTIHDAHLILFVKNAKHELDSQEKKILHLLKNHQYLIVNNKADLLKKIPNKEQGIFVSAKHKDIDPLIQALTKIKIFQSVDENCVLPSTIHIAQLKHISHLLDLSQKSLKDKAPIDLICEYIHEAYDGLLAIVDNHTNSDFVDELFKHFCVGK